MISNNDKHSKTLVDALEDRSKQERLNVLEICHKIDEVHMLILNFQFYGLSAASDWPVTYSLADTKKQEFLQASTKLKEAKMWLRSYLPEVV